MTREEYQPGAADVAHVEKNGEDWTLVLVKELRHAPDKVWEALTDPKQLAEWAPFDADRSLAEAGATVKLTTFGAPAPHVVETQIKRADAPKVLEYQWGGGDVRWELDAGGIGTKLTLWAKIDRRYIAMGAAGWQICLDVLDQLLAGEPIGRFAGPATMQFDGWQRLNKEYSEKFGVAAPSW
jgi:uncharacterized protein YndB with AHSA1/START domain